SHTCVPQRLESRKLPTKFFEIHAIRALVGAGIVGKFYCASGYNGGHDFGQIPNAVIVGGLADVESFITYLVGGCLERRNERARDILNMYDRPPRRAICLQVDLPRRERPSHEIV